LPPVESDMAAQVFKDPYLFDFLGTADPRLSSQTKCNTIMIRCCHYGKTISTFHAGRPLYDCPTS
jgi:hypothetical protein